jgi:Zn-dependent M28 family amino/carboxypeptidase
VAGYVPGRDPLLREEWLVYVAHYDHVAFGEPEGGDSIWNGFIDNAAGSAMLLEIARAMAADPPLTFLRGGRRAWQSDALVHGCG